VDNLLDDFPISAILKSVILHEFLMDILSTGIIPNSNLKQYVLRVRIGV
jgi:hypothetical protein